MAASSIATQMSSPTHAHHFESLAQQKDASSLGMWLFLVTELMFFGGLFLAYTVYRNAYFPAFAEASRHLDLTLGAVNTAILIFSSLTMALGVRASMLGDKRATVYWLMATILLGCAFLGIKVVEYADKFHHHLVPGPGFVFPGPHGREAQMFYSLYFAMTGLHAAHVIIGIPIVAVIAGLAGRGRFTPEYHAPVEYVGLYWHFVDIVWIFLFPLLYLIERHP
jgi:cytochrome c oxidase subunit 3